MPKGDTPGIDWDSHRRAAQAEDLTWLTSIGVPLEDACARVGLTVEAWEKRCSPARTGREPLPPGIPFSRSG